ncbi:MULTISPECIES: hypothetical protein [unclassified Streptomyces]|uniref:hypothetical protein n=1 Tax=unclassified Streptomyces TaxID=2593676 RepID=UPI0036E1A278
MRSTKYEGLVWNMANPNSAKYGQFYWRIDLTSGEVVHAHADEVEILTSGALVLKKVAEESSSVLLAFAAGEWKNVQAASVMDGHAVCVDHWDQPGKEAR